MKIWEQPLKEFSVYQYNNSSIHIHCSCVRYILTGELVAFCIGEMPQGVCQVDALYDTSQARMGAPKFICIMYVIMRTK